VLKPLVVVSFLALSLSLAVLVIPAEASTKEVLYVAGPQASSTVMLYTYSVDPTTAAATQVGSAINVASGSLVPLSIGTSHYLYLWSKIGVWLYQMDADGAPLGLSQFVAFSFSHPVNTFLIDPNGKFAYAALGWPDYEGSANSIILFTIDQSTGKLTNTNEVVASYSNEYTGFRNFSFAQQGGKLSANMTTPVPTRISSDTTITQSIRPPAGSVHCKTCSTPRPANAKLAVWSQ